MTKRTDSEDRRQQRLRRLGTQNPNCVACGESDPAVLELHHVAGQKHHDAYQSFVLTATEKLPTSSATASRGL